MSLPPGRYFIQSVVSTAPPGENNIGCLTLEENTKVGAKRVLQGGIDIDNVWVLEPVNSTGFNAVKMLNSGGFAKDNEGLLFVYYMGPDDAQAWALKHQPHAGDSIFEIELQGPEEILRKWAVSSDNKQVQVLPALLVGEKGFSTLFRITPVLKK